MISFIISVITTERFLLPIQTNSYQTHVIRTTKDRLPWVSNTNNNSSSICAIELILNHILLFCCHLNWNGFFWQNLLNIFGIHTWLIVRVSVWASSHSIPLHSTPLPSLSIWSAYVHVLYHWITIGSAIFLVNSAWAVTVCICVTRGFEMEIQCFSCVLIDFICKLTIDTIAST